LYGPHTDICTFVLLNDYDPLGIRDLSADAIIAAGPWAVGQDKAVEFRFDKPAVFSLEANGTVTRYGGFSAQVKRTEHYYDIYHMNGGIDPEP
jgi:hypothetical protein